MRRSKGSIAIVIYLSSGDLQKIRLQMKGLTSRVQTSAPFVELSNFSFQNELGDQEKFVQNLTWKNIGTQPVTAFQIIVLKYDPSNLRTIGDRWNIDGKNSADWSPLEPGERRWNV